MSDFKTNFRSREIELIFSNLPKKYFKMGLELGAGSGVQAQPLFSYCHSLVCTEYNTRFNIDELKKNDMNIKYQVCDAEKVDQTFRGKNFDLVFSSNMMEHLPNPDASFGGIYNILNDDGVSIHTMPSVFMKLLYIILFYPYVFHIVLKSLIRKIYSNRQRRNNNIENKEENRKPVHNNNPKFSEKSKNSLIKFIIPSPHGACDSNIKELFYWRKKRWIKQIESHGFIVIKTIRMPVTTGYSFKLERLCELLFRIGFCSSYAYVAVKRNNSNAVKFFL